MGKIKMDENSRMAALAFPLVAVDVGNRRMKFGWFGRVFAEPGRPAPLPEPESVFSLENRQEDYARLEGWLHSVSAGAAGELPESVRGSAEDILSSPAAGANLPKCFWWIGSVNRPAAARLIEWIGRRWPQSAWKLLQGSDLPIQVQVEQPERVGVDRLLNALAADRLREAGRPAVVVDVGSAITVDWVSPNGVFCGGAILPGLEMAARALHEFTDLLPEVSFPESGEPPPALGTHTEAAIRSGLFWGAVGAIRELIDQQARQAAGQREDFPTTAPWNAQTRRPFASVQPQVFLTGGAGPLLAPQLGPQVQYLPHLTLAGIALAAQAGKKPSQ